jgi:hypothetical protein
MSPVSSPSGSDLSTFMELRFESPKNEEYGFETYKSKTSFVSWTYRPK